MKCLIINGSPSKSYVWNGTEIAGFTSKLTEQVVNAMALMTDIEFAEVRLIDVNIPYCQGCYQCFNKGEAHCPHRKFMKPIMDRVLEADCLIMTSPVYALNITGLLKNFIDHGAYHYHRPAFSGKKALVISSTAGGMAAKNCKYMAEVLYHWGFNKVYKIPVIRHGANQLSTKMIDKCHKIADALMTDLSSGKIYAPSFTRIFFYNLWRVMNSGKEASPADREYWEKNGMFASWYFPSIPIHPIKKAFGRLTGFIVSKWFMDNQNRPVPVKAKGDEVEREAVPAVEEEGPIPVSDETVVATEKQAPMSEEIPPQPLPADIPRGFFDDVLAAEEEPPLVMPPRTRATRATRAAAQKAEAQEAVRENPFPASAQSENGPAIFVPEPDFTSREGDMGMDMGVPGMEAARIGFVSEEEMLAAEAQAPAKPKTRTRSTRKTAPVKTEEAGVAPLASAEIGDLPGGPGSAPGQQASAAEEPPQKPVRKTGTRRRSSAETIARTQASPEAPEGDDEKAVKSMKPADAAETAKAAKAAVAKAAKAAVSRVEKVAAGTTKPAKEEAESRGTKKKKSPGAAAAADSSAAEAVIASETEEGEPVRSAPRKRTKAGAAKSVPAKGEATDAASKKTKPESQPAEKKEQKESGEEPEESLNADEMIVVDETPDPASEA